MSQNPPRPVMIAGNWKMYKTIEEALGFVETLAPLIAKSQVRVYLAVPFTAIYPTSKKVQELKLSLTIGAQNMNDASEGAFTGEIAAKMLLDAGAQFVILGHSERRQIFNESSAFINRKLKQALACNLQSIVCIGETLEERQQGRTEEILKNQLDETLNEINSEDFSKIILAYEPVWAIGTGSVAQPEDAEEAHKFCRSYVSEKWGEEISSHLVIQYGGSVKPENAADLLKQEDIDGLLVGGASLSPQEFGQIINTYSAMNNKV